MMFLLAVLAFVAAGACFYYPLGEGLRLPLQAAVLVLLGLLVILGAFSGSAPAR